MDRKLTPLELKAAAQWLLDTPPVKAISENEIDIDQLEGKNFVDKIYNYFKNSGKLQVTRGDWTIEITKSGIRTSRQKGLCANKINAYAAVFDVLKHGRIIDFNENWKGRGYNSYIIDAPIKIGSEEFICEIVVNHQVRDNSFTYYVHEVEEKRKLRGATMPWGGYHLPTGVSRLKIAELLNSVNYPQNDIRAVL